MKETIQHLPNGTALITYHSKEPVDYAEFPVLALGTLTQFTSLHRPTPFWMVVHAGTSESEVIVETQFLLGKDHSGQFVAVIPLVTDRFRAHLLGKPDGLHVAVESGDIATRGTEFAAIAMHRGTHPHVLLEMMAQDVASVMDLPLRSEKPVPEFVDDFGWCTWDAFYGDVSHDKVVEGLASFAEGGVTPKYLILDDGWQSTVQTITGEYRLTSFAANAKFPGGLRETVRVAKEEFGVERFFVWHAIQGYWGGIDMPAYQAPPTVRRFGQGLLSGPDREGWWISGLFHNPKQQKFGVVARPSAHEVSRFYHDYHRYLRTQGVDGVKIDNQSSLEGLAAGEGGYVEFTRRYREAIEGSVAVHFQGNVINCMSCGTAILYNCRASQVTRSSDDFYPSKPESHGAHLAVNALVSSWFGYFIQPDWDMFQSGHERGGFHAAGRAVSGGPVYVSDKPKAHNFEVIRRLAAPDGTVTRGLLPGKPTADCILGDWTKEPVALKVFTPISDEPGAEAATVGVFHCTDLKVVINATVSALDAELDPDGDYLAWTYGTQTAQVVSGATQLPISLSTGDYEVITFTPVEDGFALIGNPTRYNSATDLQVLPSEEGVMIVTPHSEPIWAWSERPVTDVRLDRQPIDFEYDATSKLLKIAGHPQEAEMGVIFVTFTG